MTLDIKTFRTNVDKENDGVWTDDLGGGFKLKLARFGNTAYKDAVRAAGKPLRAQARSGHLETESIENLQKDGMAVHVIKDWKNLTDDGKKITYSPTNARRLLDIRDFHDMVVELASDMQLYQDKDLEDDKRGAIESTGVPD